VAKLQELVQSYTPASLSAERKVKIVEVLSELLEGKVKMLLFSCLLTCPWFAATKDQPLDQAKHNQLFVVYTARTEEILSLATQHEKKQAAIINQAGITHNSCETILQYCPPLQLASSQPTISSPQPKIPLLSTTFHHE